MPVTRNQGQFACVASSCLQRSRRLLHKHAHLCELDLHLISFAHRGGGAGAAAYEPALEQGLARHRTSHHGHCCPCCGCTSRQQEGMCTGQIAATQRCCQQCLS